MSRTFLNWNVVEHPSDPIPSRYRTGCRSITTPLQSPRSAAEDESGAFGRVELAQMLQSAFTPRSVVSPDLEHGRRGIPHDLVLHRHRLEPPLAARSILRRRRAAGFQDADIGDCVVGAIVPAQDGLR